MTTASPTTSPTASGHVTIVFTSDWGVSTGVGHAGRTHSTIERCGDDPVVRGTVITGVLREQAMLAAKALDEQKEGKWTSFALWLFGQSPDSEPGSTPHPRHVLFSDATPASSIPVHDTVSLSIDPDTGTARDQFLRFTERAASSRARSRSSTRPGLSSPINVRLMPRASSWGSRASWSEASARAAAEVTASARSWSAIRTT